MQRRLTYLVLALVLLSLPFIIFIVFAQVGFKSNDVAFYYVQSAASTNAKFRGWNISADAIGTAENMNDTSLATDQEIVGCSIPNRNQTIVVTADNNQDAAVQVHNGTPSGVFGNNITLTTNLVGTRTKLLSCAVEELSGKGIAEFSDAGSLTFDNMSIWNGTVWEIKNITADPDRTVQTKHSWLVSRYGSNEMAWFGATTFNQSFVAVWNATANQFYDVVNLTARNEENLDRFNAPAGTLERNKTVDCAFESISGNLVCFYGNYSDNQGNLNVFIRNATEAAVNPQAKEFRKFNVTTANISKKVSGVWSNSNPTSNEILVLAKSNQNLSVMIWNGTNLGNFLQIETSAQNVSGGGTAYKIADIAYHYFTDNSTATEALFCWANTPDNGIPNCRVWNGTTYTGEINAQDVTGGGSASDVKGMFLSTSINNKVGLGSYWAFLATTDEDNDVNIQTFNSSVWGNLNELETAEATSGQGMWVANVWSRYDNSTPVFRSVGTNETDNAINASSAINLNASIRDNFQLDCWWIETNETGKFTNYTDGTRFNCTTSKSAVWQYANISWTNTSLSGINATIQYDFCANDTNGNKACSNRQTFLISTSPPVGGGGGATININATDTATSIDNGIRQLNATRTQPDTSTSSNSINRKGTFNRQPSDQSTSVDAVFRSLTAIRTATDTATSIDVVFRSLTTSKIANDILTSIDNTIRSLTATRATTDQSTSADSPYRSLTANRNPNDAATSIDNLYRSLTASRIADDIATSSDSLFNRKSGTFYATVSDIVASIDDALRSLTAARTVTDSSTSATLATLQRTAYAIANDVTTSIDNAIRKSTFIRIFDDFITSIENAVSGGGAQVTPPVISSGSNGELPPPNIVTSYVIVTQSLLTGRNIAIITATFLFLFIFVDKRRKRKEQKRYAEHQGRPKPRYEPI